MELLLYIEVLTTRRPPVHFIPLSVCLSLSLHFFISFLCLPVFKSAPSWPVWDFITLALVITSQLWCCWYRRNKRWRGKKGRVEKSDRWNVGQWRCARGSFSLRFSLCLSLPGPQLKRLKETGGESASHPHLPLSCLTQAHRSSDRVISQKTTLMTDAAGPDANCVWQKWLFSASTGHKLLSRVWLSHFLLYFVSIIFLQKWHRRSNGVTHGSKRTRWSIVLVQSNPILPVWLSECAVFRNLLKHCHDETRIL